MTPATNPIVSSGADPWVILWEKAYYYCFVKDRQVCVSKAPAVADGHYLVQPRSLAFLVAPTPGGES